MDPLNAQSFGVGRSLVLRRPIEEYGFTVHALPTEDGQDCIIRFMTAPWLLPLHRLPDSDLHVHCSAIGPVESEDCRLCKLSYHYKLYMVIVLVCGMVNMRRLVMIDSDDLRQIQDEIRKDDKRDPYHLNFTCRLNPERGQPVRPPRPDDDEPVLEHPTYLWERIDYPDPMDLKTHQAEAEEMMPMLEDVNRNIETANRYLVQQEQATT